jgi:hypothetical protein
MKDETDTKTRRHGETGITRCFARYCFCSVSPRPRVPASDFSSLILHPWSFQTPCQKPGFGVKSPSVFETMATGAFSRERSLRLVGGRVFPKTRRKNNLWLAKRLYSI